MPPENYDPASEADVVAYFETIPNFLYAGRWFSKARYGLVSFAVGPEEYLGTHLVRIDKGKVQPDKEPEDCFDEVDWVELQAVYDDKKAHLVKVKGEVPAYSVIDYSKHGHADAEKRRALGLRDDKKGQYYRGLRLDGKVRIDDGSNWKPYVSPYSGYGQRPITSGNRSEETKISRSVSETKKVIKERRH